MHRAGPVTPIRSLVRRWWPLGIEVVAGIVLVLVRVLPAWPGTIHLVGLPPVDLAGDLQILVARSSSYPGFVAGVAAALATRTLLTAALLWSVQAVPTFGAALARAAVLYAVAVVPLAAAAGLGFAGLAAVYAWYAWAGLALTVLVVLVVAPRLIPRGVRVRRIPGILGYLVALTALGGLAKLAGPGGAVAGVVASALLTAVVLDWLVRPPAPARAPAPAPAAAALIALLGTVGVPGHQAAQASPDAVALVVPGVDTASGRGAAYRMDPTSLGFGCDRVYYFSYRGPGDGAPAGEAHCPIRVHRPYAESTTHRPLRELVRAMADQVSAIRETHPTAPLVLITHSQGAVIAWRAVASRAVDGVSHLIGLAGFVHSPVGYPSPRHPGAGMVGADALRVLSWSMRFLGGGSFDPDGPLAREVLARSDGLESVFTQPLPGGVTAALVFATSDLIVAPEGRELPRGPTVMVDATHVSITESTTAQKAIRDLLAGRSAGGLTFGSALLGPALPQWVPPPAGA